MFWAFVSMVLSAVWGIMFRTALVSDGWSSYYVTAAISTFALGVGLGLWTPWNASWVAAVAPVVGVIASYAHGRATLALGASEAAAIVSAYPLLMIVWEAERLNARSCVGIVLCIAGMILLGGDR
jgi:hypothetical protein